MAKEKKIDAAIKRGLITDSSYLNQPAGALTFALNTVNESEAGDKGWRINEQSNEECYTLPNGYVPIGEIYIGKNQSLIFSCSQDEQLNEIGITDANCNYSTIVRAFLGFKIANQISGTYRLRRGCERTFYFSTPTPMIFNIDKLDDFKTEGQWDIDKFKLFKIYKDIPTFDGVEIIENGALIPGSYNASIQYIDDDLNPTEWITTCEPIKIYNDSTSKEYKLIRGSTSVEDNITNFGLTNKSIKFTFGNFDDSYPFYRVAIIESNAGTGLVTAVNFSAPISTAVKSFTYSGLASIVTTGTEEEVIAFNNIITEAEYIEQIENRLILAKTKGPQINFCNLQKYASRIRADLSLKEIVLNAIGDANPKTETVNFDGTGYMPGEIYSFGIVYIFEDSSVSPTYHIPGRAEGYSSLMSSSNKGESIRYTSNDSCKDYWGLDSEGDALEGQVIRHHRFPSRSEINEPLYTKIKDSNPFFLNFLNLDIQGTPTSGTTIEYTVQYTVDGVAGEFNRSILVAEYDPLVGIQDTITSSRGVIIVTDILEGVDGAAQVSVGTAGTASPATDLTYVSAIIEQEVDSSVSFFTSKVMGITFSGIEVPVQESLKESKVVGYYIVRNERTEEEKTILDSGVVVPMLDETRGFVAHGHMFPNLSTTDRIKKDIFALIHPEHRFKAREYRNLTDIVQEGEYLIDKQSRSSVVTQDVGAGTSYDPDVHKSFDGDGFSLHTLTRDTEVSYNRVDKTFLDPFNKQDIFYLNTLNSKVVTDVDGERKDVYNVSGDNKIGVLQLNEEIANVSDVHNKLPYVVLRRNLSDPYGNFRVLPYYKESRNPHTIEEDNVTIFNGDSYIVPMRYHSAMFNDFRLKKRGTKSGVWKIIVGAIIIVIAAVAAYFTAGTSLALIGAGAALMAAGYGISSISSGIEQEQMAKVYQDIYEAGLRDTIQDDDTTEVFGPNPSDDEMQWLGDTVTNLWFETGINIGLRHGTSIALTDFLNAPDERADEGIFSGGSFAANPVNELDRYMLEKLTVIDTDNGDGRLYKGYAGAELYFLNEDYTRLNKQKVFFSLGLEYDCCSECTEDFPHRSYYSEQSFQEELTDNYRIFLPNNYRDIEGEKGIITDLFRIQNNLYIHTEGSLWHLPQNIQERITGDVVSFIGTGEFFSIPPRKVTDADKASAGTYHNWGRMKTENGVLFPSEDEGKIFLFDGNSLNPISSYGNENWFRRDIKIKADNDYLISSGVPYPLANNPSSKYGTGFISAYDTTRERFILTKKDYIFSDRILGGTDYNSCVLDGDFVIFDDYQALIDQRALDGWEFNGIENCRMKFSKEEITQEEQTRDVITTIPSTAHVHYFLDTSGSFGASNGECLESIRTAVQAWHASLGTPDVQLIEHLDSTERWVNYAQAISAYYPPGTNLGELDIITVSFCNEASTIYHGNTLNSVLSAPTSEYIDDYDTFTGTNIGGNNPSNYSVYNLFNSFFGIHYPIVFGPDSSNCSGGTNVSGIEASKEFLAQSIASLEGQSLSLAEASVILTPQNLGFDTTEWAMLSTALQGVNDYPSGLKNFNWVGKWDRNSVTGQPVINEVEFNQDITDLLVENITVEQETVIVNVTNTISEYVEGVVIEEPVDYDNSWTMSYSLEDKEWISWHSYLPNFYLYRLNEFFSWKHGNNDIWKHNRDNHYQTFYGVLHPHIIEYVDNRSPKDTKLWDYVALNTEAKQFNETYQEDVDVDVTFNKLIAYTSRQTTGLVNIVHKEDGDNYLDNQILNSLDSIIIDRNEKNWTLNDLRDVRTNYALPIFRKDYLSLQSEYYIDKVLNNDSIDFNKDWNDLQSFRDKYLVLRLIFDNFDNTRLVTQFTEENPNPSFR